MLRSTVLSHKQAFTNAFIGSVLFLLLTCSSFGQSLPKPRFLSDPHPYFKALILPAAKTCRPNARLAYGWMTRDELGRRWDFALVPADCGSNHIKATDRSGAPIQTVFQLHISAPGGNPRNPEILTLYLSDFDELAGPNFKVLYTKSWLSDRWDDIKDFISQITAILKPLIADIKKIIGDAKELWKDIEKLVEDARPLIAMVMGKGESSAAGRKAVARLLVTQAQTLKSGGSLLPHQRLGSALSMAMQQDPNLVKLFADSARTLTKGR